MSTHMPNTHAEAWDLLPWLANGRIAPEQREWVEAHVYACADCRAELEAQRKVATQMNRDGAASPASAASDEQRSFNKLWARIEASESINSAAANDGVTPRHSVARSSRTVRWLAAAVIVQGFGLAFLGISAVRGTQTGNDFVTVSNPPATRTHAPAVRIVFAPETSIGTMNTLLSHQGLELVAGPGTSGNFTAVLSTDAVASGATAESIAAVIAKDPHVSFAQPVAR